MTPEQQRKMFEARDKLQAAMQEMISLSYEPDGVGHMYVQDWVLCVASESMQPGHGNKTFLCNFSREGMPTYQIIGLLGSAKRRYQNG